jgi:hypothetical protein
MDALIVDLRWSLTRMDGLIVAGRDASDGRVAEMGIVSDAWGEIYTAMRRLDPPEPMSGWHSRVLHAARIANDLRRDCRAGVTAPFDPARLETCRAGLPRVAARLDDAHLLLPEVTPAAGHSR